MESFKISAVKLGFGRYCESLGYLCIEGKIEDFFQLLRKHLRFSGLCCVENRRFYSLRHCFRHHRWRQHNRSEKMLINYKKIFKFGLLKDNDPRVLIWKDCLKISNTSPTALLVLSRFSMVQHRHIALLHRNCNIIGNYILYFRLAWPENSEEIFLSSSQAVTSPPVYHKHTSDNNPIVCIIR